MVAGMTKVKSTRIGSSRVLPGSLAGIRAAVDEGVGELGSVNQQELQPARQDEQRPIDGGRRRTG